MCVKCACVCELRAICLASIHAPVAMDFVSMSIMNMNEHVLQCAFSVCACADDVQCAWPLFMRQWRWITVQCP